MPAQDRYIPGVPCWIDSIQADPDAAATFYAGLFGWQFEEVTPPGSPARYLIARIDGQDVGAIGSSGRPDQDPAWNTYVWVADADATATRVFEAGGTIVEEPMDVGDAGRMATFADTEGARFSVWQAGRNRGAQLVNAHGSLNFNDLHSRDRDAAERFYGAVFGWERLALGDDAAVWALPGYGDFLEELNPGMRAGMKEMGAPDRFEDVVASVIAAEPGAAPHWGVTFAVDDADAIAARVPELGGRVLVAPFDAPWVRMTVVADPAGATFVASKFVPENKDVVPAPAPARAGA